ncbi:MAG: DNA polymerase I [Gammaproteobacteria bacterium]|nr:DNA polymerase I [Gammaproteobacteria bacterium]
MKKDPLLLLVDGSSYLYRAFHALPPLTNHEGTPTGAVYGVVRMVRKLIEEEQPQNAAVIFDAKGKTFRHEMYKDYKANRPPMPDDLQVQIAPLYQLIEALGIPLLSVPDVEADDVIGTLAKTAVSENFRVLISTGDKDMAQLVDERVSLINTMNDVRMDEKGVEEKFGVMPAQIIDYLALMGDKADNIPGVPGVGPKTAVKWLQQFETMQGVIDHADEVKGKIGEKLRAAVDQLPLSYGLATIKNDVALDFAVNKLQIGPRDNATLKNIYTELNFKTWLNEVEEIGEDKSLDEKPSQLSVSDKVEYELILTHQQLTAWIKKLKNAELFAFDTETDNLDYMVANLVGMSFSVKPGEAAYLPIAHDYENAPRQLSLAFILNQLTDILQNPDIAKVGHNLKYDQSVLARYDVQLEGIKHDTMLESYVVNSTASRHDLDTLCELHLGHQNIKFEEVAGKGAKQITFNKVSLDVALDYAAEDADMSLRLHHFFWPQLSKLEKQTILYRDVEVPMISVLSRLERNGVLIDASLLDVQSKELSSKISELEKQAYKMAGEEFNLDSPKQLQKILFEQLELPVIRKTPKGQPSTAEDVLQELAHEYEFPELILEYRSLKKLQTTYVDKLPQQICTLTGRVHTSYHQAVASTGRLSSTDPNLQNIPIRTEEGRRVRQAFISSKKKVLLAADYSQIELRIMAHLSEDKRLVAAFAEEKDVHTATASEVFSVDLNKVTKDQRRAAKAVNFGLIYGMSAFGLGKQLGVHRGEAQKYIDLYFDRYPGVKSYMDEMRELAHKQGFVETIFGRRLYLPEINSRNAQRRQYAERTAINAPMQGSAADIIKRAMISIDEWINKPKTPASMIMQVHDELVFEIRDTFLEEAKQHIITHMVSAADLSVPLVVDANSGLNWDEAH